VLATAATKGMVNGIHSNTTNYWPLLGLGLELVKAISGLDQWLVRPTATGNDTDSRQALWGEALHLSAGKLDNGSSGIVGNKNGIDA
jgi:hypothetical protein